MLTGDVVVSNQSPAGRLIGWLAGFYRAEMISSRGLR